MLNDSTLLGGALTNHKINFMQTNHRNSFIKYHLPSIAPTNSLKASSFTIVPDTTTGLNISKDIGQNNISRYKGNVFLSGIDYSSFPVNEPNGNLLIVSCADTNVNIKWTKTFGGNNYWFFPSNILATKDGGCIMLAYFYDSTNPNQQFDHYIFKLDSLGNVVNVNEFFPSDFDNNSIYPNPFYEEINIKRPIAKQETFNLYDNFGKLILSKTIEANKEQINTSHLAAGLYFYSIVNKNGERVKAGKVVKE